MSVGQKAACRAATGTGRDDPPPAPRSRSVSPQRRRRIAGTCASHKQPRARTREALLPASAHDKASWHGGSTAGLAVTAGCVVTRPSACASAGLSDCARKAQRAHTRDTRMVAPASRNWMVPLYVAAAFGATKYSSFPLLISHLHASTAHGVHCDRHCAILLINSAESIV